MVISKVYPAILSISTSFISFSIYLVVFLNTILIAHIKREDNKGRKLISFSVTESHGNPMVSFTVCVTCED